MSGHFTQQLLIGMSLFAMVPNLLGCFPKDKLMLNGLDFRLKVDEPLRNISRALYRSGRGTLPCAT